MKRYAARTPPKPPPPELTRNRLLTARCERCEHTFEFQERQRGDGIMALKRKGWVIDCTNRGLRYYCAGCAKVLRAGVEYVSQIEVWGDDNED